MKPPVESWARAALAAEGLVAYAAFLRVVGDEPSAVHVLGAVLLIVLPLLHLRVERLVRAALALPAIVFAAPWVVQLLPLLCLRPEPQGVHLMGLLAVVQGQLLRRGDEDRCAAASVAVAPTMVVLGLALAPTTDWLLVFPLALVTACAAILLLQARRTRRALAARAHLSPGPEVDRRSALVGNLLYAVPLTLVLIVAITLIFATAVALPQPVLGSDSAAAPTTEDRPEPEPGTADADAAQAFSQIFPQHVDYAGGPTRLRHEKVLEVRPQSAEDLGPIYLRGMVIDVFSDGGAHFSGGSGARAVDVGPDGWAHLAEPSPTGDPTGEIVAFEILQQPVYIGGGSQGLYFAAQRVLAVDADVLYDPDGLLVVEEPSRDWFHYTVVSQERRGTLLPLGRERARHDDPRYLQLPTRSRELRFVTDLARDIVTASRTDSERVERVVDWFRSSFEYSLKSTDFPGMAGVVDFLKRRKGHCTYYASSATLMLRSLGIPSRVATGFVAKKFDEKQGAYIVTTREGHAWIEVHFESLGWTTFDPTPPDLRDAALAAALREPSSGLGDWFGELAYDLRRWAASGDADYMRDFAAALADGPHALWESARRAPVWVWIVLGAAVLALMARRLVGRPVSIRGAR
ncbi:MAG: transglutaminase-like domain-containing protein, partial [Planctomycetota bacterium]|nr:transglutaminase-like domain-containing protein [Planctomycetota bacterium]